MKMSRLRGAGPTTGVTYDPRKKSFVEGYDMSPFPKHFLKGTADHLRMPPQHSSSGVAIAGKLSLLKRTSDYPP